MEMILGWVTSYGAVSLFFLLMLGIIGLPVPDETLLVFSGYLIFSGRLDPVLTFAGALGGSLAGITGSYWIGRTFGHRVIHKYGKYVHLTEERLERVHTWFRGIGHWTLFVGYYIPGVRHFTALVAGASDLEVTVFSAYAYSGALVWVSAFLGLGYLLGERWRAAWDTIHSHLHVAGIAIIGAVALGIAGRWLWMRRSR